MRLLALFWKLLRYRVAIMLVLFMLLAVAIHGQLQHNALVMLLAVAALAFSYVSATSSNDLADEKIDKLNHPASPGRPLVNGEANRKDMWIIFSFASAACLACSVAISSAACLIMLASVAINLLYSMPPTRLSYRTYLAPLVLGLAYVCIPYFLGLAAIAAGLTSNDLLWLAGLYLMFVGRIILKDFRDRKGDAKYGKPTFLLRYGKDATCLISLAGLLVGGGILAYQARFAPWLIGIVIIYVASILAMLRRLQQAPIGQQEQLSIGVGAKMGNGLLVALLCTFLLQEAGAAEQEQVLITSFVTVLFFSNYFVFLRYPQKAVIGYKG